MSADYAPLIPGALAAGLLSWAAARSAVFDSHAQSRRAVVLVLLTLFLSGGLALVFASTPSRNLLMRDVVAQTILATLMPVATSIAVRQTANDPPWARAIAGVMAALVVPAVYPIVLLLVHCSSGDCL